MNPFIIYSITFLSAMTLYLFNWSKIYPKLSIALILFLLITSTISLIISLKVSKSDKWSYEDAKVNKYIKYIFGVDIFLLVLDFLYAGDIPLLNLSGKYLEFTGIPSIHVIIYTFNIFLGVYLFHLFISTKRVSYLMMYGVTFIPGVLLVSRGMIMNILIGSAIIVFMKFGNKISFYKKNFVKIFLVALSVLFIFGVSGNLRNNTINGSSDKFSSDYIMSVGKASQKFRNSIIPKEFFWGYIYISSPLANLQNTITYHNVNMTPENLKSFISDEITIDFVGKRVFKDYKKDKKIPLISSSLTVSTFYSGAYYYMGWIGMSIMYIILIGGSYMYIKFLSKDNPFRIVGIAMLCNLVALCAFSNMITFSGMSFQLAYPLIFELYLKIIKNKNLMYKFSMKKIQQ